MVRARWAGAAALAPFLLVFLSGEAWAAAVHVHIANFAFDPNETTVAIGDSVTWHNHDGATHTATDIRCPRAGGAGPCEFDSLNLGNGGTFAHGFPAAGLFDYKCTIHGFTGVLMVDAPGAVPDLAVAGMTLVDVAPAGLLSKRVDVNVTNVGADAAGKNRLHLVYETADGPVLIGDADIPAMAAGAFKIVRVTWNVSGKVGDFVLRATADNLQRIAEADETNNEATRVASLVTPPGVLPGVNLLDPA